MFQRLLGTHSRGQCPQKHPLRTTRQQDYPFCYESPAPPPCSHSSRATLRASLSGTFLQTDVVSQCLEFFPGLKKKKGKKEEKKERAIGGCLFTVGSLAVDRPELISRPVIPQAAPLSLAERRKAMLSTQSQSISRATWAAGHDLRHSIPDLFVHPVHNSQPVDRSR